MSHKLDHRHLLDGAGGGDDLQGGPHCLHADEHVGGEVVVSVLHHEVARQGALVSDPHAGDEPEVSADCAPLGVWLSSSREEVNGVCYSDVPSQEHWTLWLRLQLSDLIDVDEGVVGFLVSFEDSGASVPPDNSNSLMLIMTMLMIKSGLTYI